jgi:hypothetical protein
VWFLNDHPISRVEQYARGQIERLLRTIHDHHLGRVTGHATRPSQIVGNGLAQRRVAFWGTIL